MIGNKNILLSIIFILWQRFRTTFLAFRLNSSVAREDYMLRSHFPWFALILSAETTRLLVPSASLISTK